MSICSFLLAEKKDGMLTFYHIWSWSLLRAGSSKRMSNVFCSFNIVSTRVPSSIDVSCFIRLTIKIIRNYESAFRLF